MCSHTLHAPNCPCCFSHIPLPLLSSPHVCLPSCVHRSISLFWPYIPLLRTAWHLSQQPAHPLSFLCSRPQLHMQVPVWSCIVYILTYSCLHTSTCPSNPESCLLSRCVLRCFLLYTYSLAHMLLHQFLHTCPLLLFPLLPSKCHLSHMHAVLLTFSFLHVYTPSSTISP